MKRGLFILLWLGLLVWFWFWILVWVERIHAQEIDSERLATYTIEWACVSPVGREPLCGPILVYRFGLHREWWWVI